MDLDYPLNKLKTYLEKENYKGFDPYDALNSPLLRALTFNQKYLRIAFIQALKRSPLNVRPLISIKKDYNPKGLGLMLWGYAKLYKVESNPEYLEKIARLLKLLQEFKSKGYSGNCWGYNFDWQSRAFYVPRYTPTIVNSAFIGHALLDTYDYTGNNEALQLAIPIKDFILKDLNRKDEDGTICFSYTPIDRTTVHNANLLGASLLIRLYKITNDENLKEKALASLAYTMRYQRQDGSWYYADTNYQNWIDSFHTGFNLQSIHYFLKEGFAENYIKAFKKGLEFYIHNFFLPDGTPKYYHKSTYPVDIHSFAQAIVLLSRLGNEHRALTDRILTWSLTNMVDSKGFFYFQKWPYFTNKIAYIRWGQAWAFHALTDYYLNDKRKFDESNN